MEQITTIGLDIAKNVFQVHGIGADGAVVIRRQLRRAQVLAFFKKQLSFQSLKVFDVVVGYLAINGKFNWSVIHMYRIFILIL